MTPDELLSEVEHQQLRTRRRMDLNWFILLTEGAALGVSGLAFELGGDRWGVPVMVLALGLAFGLIARRMRDVGRTFAWGRVTVPAAGLALSGALAGGALLLYHWLDGPWAAGAAHAWLLLGTLAYYLWLRQTLLLHVAWMMAVAGAMSVAEVPDGLVIAFWGVAMAAVGALGWRRPQRTQ